MATLSKEVLTNTLVALFSSGKVLDGLRILRELPKRKNCLAPAPQSAFCPAFALLNPQHVRRDDEGELDVELMAEALAILLKQPTVRVFPSLDGLVWFDNDDDMEVDGEPLYGPQREPANLTSFCYAEHHLPLLKMIFETRGYAFSKRIRRDEGFVVDAREFGCMYFRMRFRPTFFFSPACEQYIESYDLRWRRISVGLWLYRHLLPYTGKDGALGIAKRICSHLTLKDLLLVDPDDMTSRRLALMAARGGAGVWR